MKRRVENVLIAGLIAFVAIVVLKGIGKSVNTTLVAVNSNLEESEPHILYPASTTTSPAATPRNLEPLLNKLRPGEIAFNAPRSLAYGETTTIRLLLSSTMTQQELIKLIEEEGEKQGYKIQISNKMQAQLTGEAFTITPITPDAQAIAEQGATVWSWDISSRKRGEQRLHLTISAIVIENTTSLPHVIQTFSKTIVVNVPPSSVVYYLKDNWVVLSAIAGLVGAFLKLLQWNHDKKKQAKQQTQPGAILPAKRHRRKKSLSV